MFYMMTVLPNRITSGFLFFLFAQSFFSQKMSAQQELGLSFLPENIQSLSVNPAFFPEKKWTVALPSFYADGSFSADLGLREMFPKNADGSTGFDVDRVLSKLDAANNRLTAGYGLETIGFCWKKDRLAFTLTHAQRTDVAMVFPKKLVELLWLGNAQFIGDTIEIAPGFDAAAWQELSLGISMKKGPVTFGGRAKFLLGGAAARTDKQHISVYTNPDIYQIRMETDFGFTSAGDVLRLDTAGLGFDPTVNFPKPKDASAQNFGIGIDLGGRLDLGKIQLAVSLLDIGSSISWKKNAEYRHSQGVFEYDGVDFPATDIVNGDDLDFSGKLDSLNDALNFVTTANDFETVFPSRAYFTGQFSLGENWQLGATYFYQKSTEKLDSRQAVAVSLQRFLFKKILMLGGQYSLDDHSVANFGATLGLNLKYARLFATTDVVQTAFSPYKNSRVNFRVGASAAF